MWVLLGSVVMVAACGPKIKAPPEAPLAVRRGDEAYRYRDYDTAIKAYRAHVDLIDRDEYTARALYKEALSEFQLGQYDNTLVALDDLQRRYPDARWVQVDALRGDAEKALGQPVAAIAAWDEAWSSAAETDRPKLRIRIVTVARAMSEAELAAAKKAVTTTGVSELLQEQSAKRKAPSLDEPMPEFEGVDVPAAAAPVAAAAEPTEADVDDGEAPPDVTAGGVPVPPGANIETGPEDHVAAQRAAEVAVGNDAVIGVLLPMSGSNAAAGDRSLKAIRMALGDEAKRIRVRDTGAGGVVQAYEDLASHQNVVAVIGPLDGDAAAPIAARAGRMHLPTLLLSADPALNGSYSVQAGITHAGLLDDLLDYAVNTARIRRLGVVYANTAYGNAILADLKQGMAKRGGSVVVSDSYSPETRAVAPGILRRWRKEQDVQAVFLADGATMAAPVAKFLESELPDVTLLGAQGWESLADGDTASSGILFAAAFYEASTRDSVRDFVAHYQKENGSMPGSLEAQAYDAGLLAKHVLHSASRSAAWSDLQGATVLGATGNVQVRADGLHRDGFVLQVLRGQLREATEETTASATR